MKKTIQFLIYGLISFVFVSCGGSDDEPSVDCNLSDIGISITNVANSDCGKTDGSISVSASGGDGNYTYKLDNGSFGASNTFSSLTPGNYEVTVEEFSQFTEATG